MATRQTHKPGRYLLLYGSQTGQSQAIAEEIFERSAKHGLQPEIHCMSMVGKKFQVENEPCVVMVTSTTGDGEPPDTAIKFVRRLNRKILPSDHLANVRYSVLGLGDSNYNNFANNAKNIDRRFSELGAQRFHPSAFADEVEGLDVAADPWIDALFPALQKLVGVCPDAGDVNGVDEPRCNGSLTVDHSESNGFLHSGPTPSDSVSAASSSESGSGERTTAPAGLNETATVDKKFDKTDASATHSVSESGDSNTDTVDKAHAIGTTPTDADGSRTANKKQTSENVVSETCAERSADCDDAQQSEMEDTLDLNTPVKDVPSLGVSTAELFEKSLTLPAPLAAFLTVGYLPPDESLSSKMAELPWQNDCKPPSAASEILRAKVVSACRLTAEDAVKKTLLLKLCVRDSSLKYRPGDSISIICANDDKEVSQLIKRLGLVSQADLPLKLSILVGTKKRRAAVPPHIPEEGISLRYVFKNCVDIREPPKKALLRHLVDYTSDAREKRRLQELCSKEGAQDYTAHVHGEHVSLLDVLYTFPSCHPPVERLIEHLPRLQPRPYSVCSCSEWQPGHADIAFSVVTVPTSNSRLYARRGLCTGWLDRVTQRLQLHAGKEETPAADPVTELAQGVESASLADIEKIIVQVQIVSRTNQHFRAPSDLSVPLIMIGPGTGVAPFIGFLQERQLRLQKEEKGGNVGETWLLFGCRHREKDFLFRSAVEEFQSNGVLTKFLPAFSRDPLNDPSTPRYVQDNIRAHASEICSLVSEKEAVVFVCGDAKHMAVDVAAAFESILMQELDLSADKAKEYLMTMRIHRRYLEDVWT
ncbi:methionine synthase reductase-like isoform X2 [Babylonia areolata]|uniref:methionine synthase reductase-like isoform X2 n=1 Tax=Babylonia areolata TaxID=304850 RepID=UPI003FCF1E80